MYSEEELRAFGPCEHSGKELFIQMGSIIGAEARDKFYQYYGGRYLYIKSLESLAIDIRNREIKRQRIEGVSVKELMFQYGLSRQSIMRIINRV